MLEIPRKHMVNTLPLSLSPTISILGVKLYYVGMERCCHLLTKSLQVNICMETLVTMLS